MKVWLSITTVLVSYYEQILILFIISLAFSMLYIVTQRLITGQFIHSYFTLIVFSKVLSPENNEKNKNIMNYAI